MSDNIVDYIMELHVGIKILLMKNGEQRIIADNIAEEIVDMFCYSNLIKKKYKRIYKKMMEEAPKW